MAGHFLLSKGARDFSLADAELLTDKQVHAWFAVARWGSKDVQTCPSCGHMASHFWLPKRNQWRCRSIECAHHFSVTSGTVFHDHKLPLKKILQAMVIFASNVKGISAAALGRLIKVAYMTAYVLLHKIRESIMLGANEAPMEGEVQMDGAHVSGKIRKPRVKKPANKTQARDKLPHSAFPKHPNRRIVMVIRQVAPEKGKGAVRSIVDIVQAESEEAIGKLAKKYIKEGATVMTDELGGYNILGMNFEHRTVNHTREFSTDDGVNNNQAESFFARVRRFIIGQVHRITPVYMKQYMNEMVWREDTRRERQVVMINNLLQLTTSAPPSDLWRGYWRGYYGVVHPNQRKQLERIRNSEKPQWSA